MKYCDKCGKVCDKLYYTTKLDPEVVSLVCIDCKDDDDETDCRGCEEKDAYERFDAYNISTGHWCDPCYMSEKYPYRKDRYFGTDEERFEN